MTLPSRRLVEQGPTGRLGNPAMLREVPNTTINAPPAKATQPVAFARHAGCAAAWISVAVPNRGQNARQRKR
ncbi:hypothetical protein HORIV_56310 [Vreelandella olivaria]|uniref:Uncharacterized protein n=1 Tax=Vreelandella olivaria TaxID=390919 RepID=A0ABM7GR66_9GAMM|nr:hypothetical protein HORIV_56310 [Halomonas olivaria]